MALRFGVVVATHPEDHSVDLVMLDTYQRIAGVTVLTANGNGAYGSNDLYAPDEQSGEAKWDVSKATSKNPIAAVDCSGHMPIVVGFKYPQVNQMTFAEKNLRVDRHASDVYSTLNAAGDYEMAWPNGTFVRIGASPDHVDLTGKGADSKWKIEKNTGAALHLRVVLGAGKLDLHVDPAGNLTLTHDGDLTLHTKGKATVNVDGTADITVGGNTHLTTPQLTVTADESTFTGHVTIENGLAVSGGTGATAAITGPMTVNGNMDTTGTLKNNGHDVGSTHKHTGVASGAGISGTPQ